MLIDLLYFSILGDECGIIGFGDILVEVPRIRLADKVNSLEFAVNLNAIPFINTTHPINDFNPASPGHLVCGLYLEKKRALIEANL